MGLNWGIVGVGQGGNNIADAFAPHFPAVVAINSALTDLRALKNIPRDRQIAIGEDGAGKNIAIGERAFKKNLSTIKDKLNDIFKGIDFVWVIGCLGGGTGSLGTLHTVGVLADLEKYVGTITTLPTDDEGTQNKKNAAIAATEIIIANEKVDLFRPMIFMDNQKLKSSLVGGKLSYEESLIQMNTIFCTNFMMIYEFSTRPAITSFDLQEYNQIFHEKGCVRFAADDFDYNPHDSDTCLLSMTKDLWEKSLFLTGDYSRSTAAAVVIERPENFDTDGKKIDTLFTGVKDFIGSGYFCRGVYRRKEGVIKKKPLTIATILSGIPAPVERINQLTEDVEREMADIEAKKNDAPKISANIQKLKERYLAEPALKTKKPALDLTVFKDEEFKDEKGPFKF